VRATGDRRASSLSHERDCRSRARAAAEVGREAVLERVVLAWREPVEVHLVGPVALELLELDLPSPPATAHRLFPVHLDVRDPTPDVDEVERALARDLRGDIQGTGVGRR